MNSYRGLTKSFIRETRKYALKNSIRKVLATISGGADSVATMILLKEIGIEILALHCNFHLRGEESNRDENYVRKICGFFDIPLMVRDFDIDAFMKENPGKSIEMACREVRHSWFREIMDEENFHRIVTGHNADDNIETLFLNLLRGSGTSGLKGMLYDTDIIWRPLLKIHKDEIISYLKSNGIEYVTDSSNLKSDYQRNFLRNEIIPLLKSRWKGFDKALDNSIEYITAESRIIDKALKEVLPENGNPLSVDAVLEFPDPELLIRKYILPLQPFTTTPGEILQAIYAAKPHKRIWNLKKGTVILQNKKIRCELHKEP